MQMRPSLRTQVLFWKKRAEEAIQRSGINYTIVRPGGLTNAPRDGGLPGQIVMAGPDAFGLPPRRQPGSILRTQVQHHQHACHVLASAPHMKHITEVGNPSASKHAALSCKCRHEQHRHEHIAQHLLNIFCPFEQNSGTCCI